MKNLIAILSLLAVLALSAMVATSCKKDPPSNKEEGIVINGKRWATCNVAAPGTFAINSEDDGMMYQWNREKGWSSKDEEIIDWDTSTPNGNKWEKDNDPCPVGWRVPTRNELQSLLDAGSEWTTLNGETGCIFGSGDNTIFLPATGYRNLSDGALGSQGADGYYWSSTSSSYTLAYLLYFRSTAQGTSNDSKSYGFPIRCIAE